MLLRTQEILIHLKEEVHTHTLTQAQLHMKHECVTPLIHITIIPSITACLLFPVSRS